MDSNGTSQEGHVSLRALTHVDTFRSFRFEKDPASETAPDCLGAGPSHFAGQT